MGHIKIWRRLTPFSWSFDPEKDLRSILNSFPYRQPNGRVANLVALPPKSPGELGRLETRNALWRARLYRGGLMIVFDTLGNDIWCEDCAVEIGIPLPGVPWTCPAHEMLQRMHNSGVTV